MTDADLASLASIATCTTLAQRSVELLIARFGSLAAALAAPLWDLRDAGMSLERIARLRAARDVDGAALVVAWRARGWHVLASDDPSFPPQWRSLHWAPSLVLVAGDPRALARPLVAIVGTRGATEYGTEVTRALAAVCAAQGVGVVAGLATGIDAVAHAAALHLRQTTVAVLPCGFDRFFPPQNRALAAGMVAAGGALVSEYTPLQGPMNQRFFARNRLVSALGLCLVVVEAGERSGTMNTVHHALEQGREVLAVPGPITSDVSRGCHLLIRDGATPLTDPAQLGEFLRTALRAGDDPLLRAVGAGGCDLLTLQARTGVAPARLLARLSALELEGRVLRRGEQLTLG